jgi:uncharacterized SAM-binding protein YcdF (DUF218 family)
VEAATRPPAPSGAEASIRGRRARGGVRKRALLSALVAAGVAWIAVFGFLFVWPPTDEPGRADAIVVLGPGRDGERLAKGLQLVRWDVAPVIVVSQSSRPGRWPLERVLCERADAICFRAGPFTTRGEARDLARLAEAHGWRRLILVTSTYHVVRARLLNGRCFDGGLEVVGADPRGGFLQLVKTAVHESGGLLYALTLARGC